ncbi:MAG: hypothetical protein DRI24_23510 [Deltaproteobacteria bacterium]|nr:MAG: hypothetical protein DRI24_23510 [Deltaproteobacteria bacterium]
MFSQTLKQRQQRQHSILANPATMPVCEDNLVSFSWEPELISKPNNDGNRGYDTNRVLGDIDV